MALLVTLQQARAHLRADTEDDDADLSLKIETAGALVLDYVSDTAKEAWTDSAGEPIEDSSGVATGVPPRIQSAVLLMTSYLYRERDGSNEYAVPTQWGYGYLPQGVTSLLYSLRRPTIA